jgi:hypothetical protein
MYSALYTHTHTPNTTFKLTEDGVLTTKYVGVISYKCTLLICAYVGI